MRKCISFSHDDTTVEINYIDTNIKFNLNKWALVALMLDREETKKKSTFNEKQRAMRNEVKSNRTKKKERKEQKNISIWITNVDVSRRVKSVYYVVHLDMRNVTKKKKIASFRANTHENIIPMICVLVFGSPTYYLLRVTHVQNRWARTCWNETEHTYTCGLHTDPVPFLHRMTAQFYRKSTQK